MKTLSTLKTLPLIGLLAAGLVLAPAVSMADGGDHGRGKDRVYQKHDGGKSHRADKGHFDRGHGFKKDHKKGHKYVQKHYKGLGHKHYGHVHNVYRPHSHNHGHGHADYVVVHDYYDDYDPFRLMLGLHFDDIDIIYRDY
jgi:hypothetical protein